MSLWHVNKQFTNRSTRVDLHYFINNADINKITEEIPNLPDIIVAVYYYQNVGTLRLKENKCVDILSTRLCIISMIIT